MKIGQFSDTFLPIVDGVGRVVYNYAEQIALKGHESYVIAPLADTGYRGKFPFEIIDYISVVLPGLPQYKIGTPTTDTRLPASAPISYCSFSTNATMYGPSATPRPTCCANTAIRAMFSWSRTA